jgi:hypothetical protein
MKYSGVTITEAPQDWQIIQRDALGKGAFKVAGTWKTSEKVFSVQLRLVYEATGGPVNRRLDWQTVELNLEDETFSTELKDIPAGGLYRLETRVVRPEGEDRRPLRGDCRHHLGVGDIYLIAGQSNASGTGKGVVYDPPQLGVHLFGNDENWKLAIHPLEDATASLHPITITSVFHGHSPWLAFGKRLHEKTSIPIGLVPCALGGSCIDQWVKEDGSLGALFDNMLDMLSKAGGKVAGVLWHQGESDCFEPVRMQKYEENFHLLVKLFEKYLGENIPVLTGQLNRYNCMNQDTNKRWSEMRELQRKLAAEYQNVFMVVSADLPLSDEIHNSAAGNVLLGERFVEAALEHIYGFDIVSAYPEPKRIVFADGNRRELNLSFRNLCGNWTSMANIQDFTVEDEQGLVGIKEVSILADNSITIKLQREVGAGAIVHSFYGNDSVVTLRDDNCRCLTPFSMPVQ